MVTPWRSRNSRIRIATLRPLSSRSRNWAALNRPCVASSSAAIADHLADGVAQEEVVVADLVHPAHARQQLARGGGPPPRAASRVPAMSRTRGGRKRASPPSMRRDRGPELLVDRREPHLVAGEPHPGAVERDPPGAGMGLQQRGEGRRRQARLEAAAQALHADADEVRVLGVERARAWRGSPAPAAPGRRATWRARRPGVDPHDGRAGDRGEGRGATGRGRGRRRRGRGGAAAGSAAPRAPPAGRRGACASSWAMRSGARRRRDGRAQVEEARRRRSCAGRWCRGSRSGRRPARRSAGRARAATRPSPARRDRRSREQHHARGDLGGAVVQVDRQPLGDGRVSPASTRERGVDAVAGRVQPRVEDHVAAADGVLG